MPVKKFKGMKGKCDALYSKIIRSRGACQRCGLPAGQIQLQTAHIISRRFSNTRCDLRNSWALCAACHRRLTDWPREHSHYITQTIGSEVYDELRALAESTAIRVDWEEVYATLRAEAQKIGLA